MGRKNKKKGLPASQSPSEGGEEVSSDDISSRGKKVIGGGIGFIVLGFFLLSFTDPLGQNWASVVSPFLIIGGYVMVGWGIFIPDPEPPVSQPGPPPASTVS